MTSKHCLIRLQLISIHVIALLYIGLLIRIFNRFNMFNVNWSLINIRGFEIEKKNTVFDTLLSNKTSIRISKQRCNKNLHVQFMIQIMSYFSISYHKWVPFTMPHYRKIMSCHMTFRPYTINMSKIRFQWIQNKNTLKWLSERTNKNSFNEYDVCLKHF